jgi:hypothetical protein
MQGSALTCNLLKSFPTKSQLKAQTVPVFEEENQVVSEKSKFKMIFEFEVIEI